VKTDDVILGAVLGVAGVWVYRSLPSSQRQSVNAILAPTLETLRNAMVPTPVPPAKPHRHLHLVP
jgi:hypothetical protein